MRQLRLIGHPEMGIIPMPDATVHVELPVDTAKTIEIPDGAKYAYFTSGTEFFATDDGTAVIPTATPTPGTQELIQGEALRTIQDGITSISCIAHVQGYLTVAFYG